MKAHRVQTKPAKVGQTPLTSHMTATGLLLNNCLAQGIRTYAPIRRVFAETLLQQA